MILNKIKEQGYLVFDGAFGTYYADKYQENHDTCEIANIKHPQRVLNIYKEYLDAGADVIKTNTFSANEQHLEYDWKTIQEVLREGYRLAYQATQDVDKIFADIGPIVEQKNVSLFSQYQKIVDIFLEEGAKNFLFETLWSTKAISEIASYIRTKCPEACIAVSFSVTADGYSRQGKSMQTLLSDCLEDDNIDICGLNCICGPLHMKQLLEKIDTQKKPILIMPNAGYPTVLSNRTYFQDSSDYFASVMKEIYQKVAIVLGGCCGTTPVYIQKLKRNLADLKPAQEIHKTDEQKQKVSVDTNPIRHKLKENKKIVAVEFDPPANCEIDRFISNAQYLKEAGVDAITIADCPIARARVDSSLLACKLHRELDIEIIPHMTCRDRNINATKALLFGLQIEGISNVLVVTGDPIPSEDRQEVKAVFNFNSQILANYIQDLNQTMFPHPFLIFGALNINAVNFEAELQKAKQKMKHGVEGFLTQPVHSQRALDNLKKAKQELDAYLLGGVLPIVSHRNAVYMNNEISGIEVDEQLVACYEGKTREEAQQLAIDISCQTIDAMKDYVDGYYLITPFNRVEIIGSIISYIHKQEERA